MHQGVLVVEVNEIAPKVFRKFAELFPKSTIRHFLAEHRLVETIAGDVPESFLYPSQSWASFNTGKPYEIHKIHWYNDKKNYLDFYWHAAAHQGRSTVIVNTLHSSPLNAYVAEGNYKLALPDCFAAEPSTFPREFEPLQEFNLAITKTNSRKSFLKQTVAQASRSILRNPRPSRWGLGLDSVSDLALITLAARARSERLRLAQFPPLASIFMNALHAHKPELGVIFTNHVAAMQHRYWYATFPEDFPEIVYPATWTEKYRGEILYAMQLLDRWLARFYKFALENNYILLITTSMGQSANPEVTADSVSSRQFDYRLEDAKLLLRNLIGSRGEGAEIEGAMVPQYTFRFASKGQADAAMKELCRFASIDGRRPSGAPAGLDLRADQSDTKITITAAIPAGRGDEILIGDRSVSPETLGFVGLAIDDHHTGHHDPVGALFVVNDRSGLGSTWGEQIDYLDYAPALKAHFGVAKGAVE